MHNVFRPKTFYKDTQEISKKEGCNDKQSKKLIQHSKRVLKTCKYMLKQLNIDDYNKQLIYKSAIFHDIAKMKYKKDHNKKAQMVLKSLFYADEDVHSTFIPYTSQSTLTLA